MEARAGEDGLKETPGTASWWVANWWVARQEEPPEVVDVEPVVVDVILEGCGEEETEERPPAEDNSGFTAVCSFRDCLFLAIFRNLWMIKVFRMARTTMGPTLRKISDTTR